VRASVEILRSAALATALLLACATALADGAGDPLNSPAWSYVRDRYFAKQTIEFDSRVQVLLPAVAEDPLAVPVTVKAEGLADVVEIVVLADLNPIQKILSYEPKQAAPELSFRFKVEQSTPVRAAMRTKDGVWHLGGAWLSAAGGGCTAPSYGSKGEWQGHLNEVNARLWPREDGSERLRLRVIHPMDTGLASGIPAFYIERLSIRDASGTELATLHIYEPIAENPVLSLDLHHHGAVTVEGRDIQGNRIKAEVAP
jgi:sulfur-oxidizing protein SoxY